MSALLEALDVEIAEVEQRQEEGLAIVNEATDKLVQLRSFREAYTSGAASSTATSTSTRVDPPPSNPLKVRKDAPKPKRAAAPSSPLTREQLTEKILEQLRKEPTAESDMRRTLGVTAGPMNQAIAKLLDAGKIEAAGKKTKSTIWAIKSTVVPGISATPAEPKAAPTTSGTQQPTLDGRILSMLAVKRMHVDEIAEELDEPESDVQAALERLRDEGNVKQGGFGQWVAEL